MGSARQVWLWFRSQQLQFPLQSNQHDEILWVTPTYAKVHQVLTNPVYAGAYVYGKTRQEHYVDENGKVKGERPSKRHRGFHLSRLYSPFTAWSRVAAAFARIRHDRRKLMNFFNSAARIVADREANGRFARTEDLTRVPGVGPRIVERIEPHVVAGEEEIETRAR